MVFRESISRTMNKLIQRVQDFSEIEKNSHEQGIKYNLLGKCLEYFQEVKSKGHSLFSLIDR